MVNQAKGFHFPQAGPSVLPKSAVCVFVFPCEVLYFLATSFSRENCVSCLHNKTIHSRLFSHLHTHSRKVTTQELIEFHRLALGS